MSNSPIFLLFKILVVAFVASSTLHGQSLGLKASYSELEDGKAVTRTNVDLPTSAQFVKKSQQIVTLVDVSIFEQKLSSILNAHPYMQEDLISAVSISPTADGTGITSQCHLGQQRKNDACVTIKAGVNQTKVVPDLSWIVEKKEKTDSLKVTSLKESLTKITLTDLINFQVVNKKFERFVSKGYLRTSSVSFVRDGKKLQLRIVFDTKNEDVFDILNMFWNSQQN